MNTKEKLKAATALAAADSLDYVEYITQWHNYSTYFACRKELKDSCYGYPTYILVDSKNNARFAEFPAEVESILISLPD